MLFAWWLFRDKLPTKDNLYRRYVIDIDAQLCIRDCGEWEVETSSHLLLNCNLFGFVWNFILKWIGVSFVLPSDASSHYYQFSFIGGAAKSRRSILQVIWLATMWEIWKKETIGFSMTNIALFSRWWTKLSL